MTESRIYFSLNGVGILYDYLFSTSLRTATGEGREAVPLVALDISFISIPNPPSLKIHPRQQPVRGHIPLSCPSCG
jgi:hypothetical protein